MDGTESSLSEELEPVTEGVAGMSGPAPEIPSAPPSLPAVVDAGAVLLREGSGGGVTLPAFSRHVLLPLTVHRDVSKLIVCVCERGDAGNSR